MKKVYLFSLSLLFAGVASAQLRTSVFGVDQIQPYQDNLMTNNDRPTENQDRAGGDVFYTNTFDTQGDWSIANVDNGLGMGVQGIWEWGTTTPAALVPGWMADITSTTKTDGYYYLNSIQYLTPTPNYQNQDFVLQTVAPIDCSTRPGVILEFEQSFRGFNASETWIQVSTNGTTWTDFQVNTGVQSNTSTDANVKLNISAVAGNQATVYIRYNWRGGTTGGYGWIVDDMTLTEAFQYDISEDNSFAGDIWTSYEYTRIPQTQGDFLTVQTALSNLGYGTPTNPQTHVIVTNQSAGVEFDGIGGTVSGALAPGDEDTITYVTTLDMATLAPGMYTITSSIDYTETDEVPSNDTQVNMIEITSNIYSHFDENGDLFYSNPGYNPTGAYDGFEFGVEFEIIANADLHGIQFMIDAGNSGVANFQTTSDPQSFDVVIYETNPADFQAPLWQTEYQFDISPSMIGQMNTLNFHQPGVNSNDVGSFAMLAGKTYRIGVRVLAGNSLWSLGNLPDEDFSSLMFGPFGAGQAIAWFSNSSEVGIELNFDEALTTGTIEKNTFAIGQNVPNPFSANSIINYSLEEGANVSVEFVDVSGKVVKTINQGNQAAGSYQIDVDGNEFSEGVYFYTFIIGQEKVTNRMVVTK